MTVSYEHLFRRGTAFFLVGKYVGGWKRHYFVGIWIVGWTYWIVMLEMLTGGEEAVD